MNRQQIERDTQRLNIIFDNLRREATRYLRNNNSKTVKVKENPFGSQRVISITLSVLDSAKNEFQKLVVSETAPADSTTK